MISMHTLYAMKNQGPFERYITEASKIYLRVILLIGSVSIRLNIQEEMQIAQRLTNINWYQLKK